MSYHFQSQMSWSITCAGLNGCLSWKISGYNQIKMYPDDEKQTSFRTLLRSYCYTVTPFGLKNAGATYQIAMNTIFHENICKTVECYIDDIAVKSHAKDDHIADLKRTFDIMRAYQLKMNPTKSFLGWPVVNSLGLSWHPKESISTRRKSVPSKDATFKEP